MSAMSARRAKIIRFPTRPPMAPPAAGALVEARRCRDQAEALVVQALLDGDGIPTVMRGRLVQSVHPFSVGGQAEVILLVHDTDAPRARLIVRRASTPLRSA